MLSNVSIHKFKPKTTSVHLFQPSVDFEEVKSSRKAFPNIFCPELNPEKPLQTYLVKSQTQQNPHKDKLR